MDESTQQIKEYIDKLPKPLQQAVLGNEWHKRLGEIGQKYSLHLDQISSLEYEVLFVMIGMEPEEDLVSNIEKEVRVSHILADQLAEEINKRIFQFILKSLEEKLPNNPERFVETNKESAMSAPAEQKTESVASNDITVPKMESAPIAEETPHQKIVDVPVNLPGEIEEAEQTVQEKTIESQPVSSPIISEPVAQQTIQQTVQQAPQSLADMKLNATVKSESEIISNTEPKKPFTSYGSLDPYREPIE